MENDLRLTGLFGLPLEFSDGMSPNMTAIVKADGNLREIISVFDAGIADINDSRNLTPEGKASQHGDRRLTTVRRQRLGRVIGINLGLTITDQC